MVFFLPLIAVISAISVALVFVGWRGRRIDRHPVCRKCCFDLAGVYPEIDICPECGSNLSTLAKPRARLGMRRIRAMRDKHQAVRVGNRKRGPWLIAMGLLGLVISIGMLLGSVANVNWDRYKPFAVLRAELRFIVSPTETARAEEILTEIMDRVTADKLDVAGLDSLVDLALKIQADPNVTWVVAWGDLIETFDAAVGLDPDRLAAYLRGAAVETITIRPSVRSGDDVPIEYRHASPRLGAGRTVMVHRRVAGGSIAGRPLSTNMGSMGSSLTGGTTGTGSSSRTSIRLGDPPVDPGQYVLVLELAYTLKDGWANDAAVITSWTERVSTSIEITPRTDDDIAMFHQDGSAEQVAVPRGTFKVKMLSVAPDGRAQLGFNCQIQLAGVYVPCAFEIIVVGADVGTDGIDSSDDIALGTIAYNPPDDYSGSRTSNFGLFADVPPGFDARTVNVVLRPSRDAARATIGLTRIWGGEILIENVPVEWPDEPDLP